MILPLHEQVRARVRDALARLHGITDADLGDSDRVPAQPDAGRSGHAGGLRPGAPAAQGAARDRAGAGRRARPDPGRRPRRSRAERLPQRVPRSPGVPAGAARPGGHACRRRRRGPRRPSSSTPRSTRTRRRTSATCATRRSATRWCACCASAATRSKCRTTSTTPACRSPTSSSASASSRSSTSTTRSASPTTTRFDYYCWDLYARVTEWYDGDKERLKIRAATLHDIEHGVDPTAEPRGVRRRHRRPRAPEDDGAAQHRLPAADVGRRHPAPEVLGARVRGAEGRPAPSTCRTKAGSPAAG